MEKEPGSSISSKDEFLRRCIEEAYNSSIGMNMKRLINFKELFEEYKQNFGFTECEKDRELLINDMIQLFLDLEKMCKLIENGELRESSVRLAGKIGQW